MTSRKMARFLLIVALTATIAQAQAGQPNPDQNLYRCNVLHLPTSWAFENPPGVIENNTAWFSEIGWAVLHLQFRSGEAAPVLALALVVDYMDADEKVIDRVPMFAQVNPSVTRMSPNQLKPAGAWGTALSQGDAAPMTGKTLGIRTGYCPARARVTFARVHFTDGSVRTYCSPGWRLGPSPVRVPALSETIPDLPVEPPISLLAKLKISALGSVLDIVPGESAAPGLIDWIRRMVQDWKFYPALLNGNPTDSELNVLFLIHAKGMKKFVERETVLQPVTLINLIWRHDLDQQAGEANRLMTMIAFLPGIDAPEFPFQEFTSSLQQPEATTRPTQ